MKKYKLAILKNETLDEHLPWVDACKKYNDTVDYKIIDLVKNDWLEQSTNDNYDFYLTRAPGRLAYFKQLYDERVYILNQVLKLPIYPTHDELLIYENKRFLSYYLEARNIPHPQTFVFYDKHEAIEFSQTCLLPMVAKTNIGAGGSGVKIFRYRKEIIDYVEKAFSQEGIKRSFLPNIRKGDYLVRAKIRLSNIPETLAYFREKKRTATLEPQKWFVIFQEYIPCDYEWRCVVVGDSYFGHKKLRSIGEKMSGTSKVGWDLPEKPLLDFLYEIVNNNHLWSQAIDIFYHQDKGYLVNELQCFWGSKNPHQMIKDGKPGRFVNNNGIWVFEEGIFNRNNSYDLRLEHIMSILDK